MIIKPNLLAQFFYYVGSYKLILEDGQLKRDLKTLWFFKRKPKFLNAEKIIVFDTEIGLTGRKLTSGYKAGGADNKTLVIKGLTSKDIETIKEFVQSHGAQIAKTDGDLIKTKFPFFNPKRWFSFRERLFLNDEGIGHIRRGWFKKRQTFLPFSSIKVYVYNGLLSKELMILGDATINLIEKISNSDNDKIKSVLSEKGVIPTQGKKYLPAILSFKRGLLPDVLIATEKGILFKSKQLVGENRTEFIAYNQITEYKKIGWYKLFAPIVIKGRRVDARQGEGGGIHIVLDGVAFYRWCTLFFFNGSLKSKLKNNCR
jgi:hypothetical protein